MSCRTGLNSPNTSYPKLVLGLSDRQMQPTAHILLAEGRALHLVDPSPLEISNYLTKVITQVEADPRLSLKNRESILRRLESGLTGEVSVTGAEMYMWTQLENRLAEVFPNLTPDGVHITREMVETLQRQVGETENLTWSQNTNWVDSPSADGRHAQKMQAIISGNARIRAEDAAFMYMCTSEGFDTLLRSPAANTNHLDHQEWSQTVKAVTEARERMQEGHSDQTDPNISNQKRLEGSGQRAQTAYQTYSDAHADSDQHRSFLNRTRVEEASTAAQRARAEHLKVIAECHECVHTVSTGDSKGATFWSEMTSPYGISRDDLWRSAEHLHARRESKELKAGLLSSLEVTRNQMGRAHARQLVLDAEGANIFDPVNKRYADMVRSQRATANA